MGKKAEMNFEIIFAVVAGAAILILAIYGTMKFTDVTGVVKDTETAKQLSIILEPMQAGFASGKTSRIEFPRDTRIYNKCYSEGFGENGISVATKMTKETDWPKPGVEISSSRYVFSQKIEEGRKLFVFSKPFEFPYRVADMLIITTGDFCFLDAPKDVKNELGGLNMPNVNFSENLCPIGSLKICFGAKSGCYANVYSYSSNWKGKYRTGYVQKGSKKMEYVGDLMYSAIFSDSEVYECNVKRLAYRTGRLGEILKLKIDYQNFRGCSSNMGAGISSFAEQIKNADSKSLGGLAPIAEELEKAKEQEDCPAW